MLRELPLFWQATLFTAAAFLLVGVSAWWFYRSPLKGPAEIARPPSPRLASLIALLLGIAALQLSIGALWDASQHITTGRVVGGEDFLWPSHIVIYSSFLLTLVVAGIALTTVAAAAGRDGVRDPRRWIRRHPLLGAVILASCYELAALPGDALWHELFGIDLTAWSPPHLLIGVSSTVVMICAVGLLVQARAAMARPAWADWGVLLLLGLTLQFTYVVGVLEWELPGRSFVVQQRPIWFYPLVGGGLAFFIFSLARELSTLRWAATATALVFYAVRGGITFGLTATGNVAPQWPLLFLLGALLMDLLPRHMAAPPALRVGLSALCFTAGFALLAFPTLVARADLTFHGLDMTWTVLTLLLASALLWPISRLAGNRLRGRLSQPPLAHG